MENGAGTSGSRSPARHKRCFVVSEFGGDEATRLERKQTLKHLVRKVLEPMGYDVQRADDIDDLGQITNQIIERLLDDDLVIADLTGLNPNVFYELAVRHAARKPVVTLMTIGQSIPFDLKDVRTVFYDLHDPDKLEAAQEELEQKVRALEENPADVRNPITVARNVSLLQQSDDPDERNVGALLGAINDLRDEVRGVARGPAVSQDHPAVRGALSAERQREIEDSIRSYLADAGDKRTTREIATAIGVPLVVAQEVLRRMLDEAPSSGVYRLDGTWRSVPS